MNSTLAPDNPQTTPVSEGLPHYAAGKELLDNISAPGDEGKLGLPARTHLLVLLGYLLLTLALTFPIALNFTTRIPFGGDGWQHIWNLWWVRHALVDLHTSPYHTDLLFYPDGASLYFHTLVLTAGLIGIPLQALGFNLLATYNSIVLLGFLLGGYGAFLLCFYLTRNTWASFVGGFVYAFAPYHFAHMIGHLNLISLQWIPFYVLLLLMALDAKGGGIGFRANRKGFLLAAGAGALLAVNAYTDWLYAIFLVLLTGMLLAWKVLLPGERAVFAERGISPFEALARLFVGGAAAFVLVAPIFFPTLDEARKGYAQQPPREVMVYSSDLVLAVMPSELHPLWGKRIEAEINTIQPYLPIKNPSERVVFLGYTVLALSAFGAWRLRRDRRVRLWASVAVATWVLSLGPVLQVMGRTHFTPFDVTVPLPYILLYKLPLLNIMRTPSRLTVLTMLALAVLVALTLAHLLARGAGQSRLRGMLAGWNKRQTALAVVFPAIVLFEFLAIPFPTIPPGWGVPIYAQIAAEPGNFGVLELPLRPFGDYMAYQTVHGKPLAGGYLSRQPPYPTLDKTPALSYFLNNIPPTDPRRAQVANGQGIQALKALGIKYVIIRWWAFTAEEKAAMQEKLGVVMGRPPDLTYPADQVDAWRVYP